MYTCPFIIRVHVILFPIVITSFNEGFTPTLIALYEDIATPIVAIETNSAGDLGLAT